jgi:Kef-type K+ transport system membrane component KefB
VDFITELAIGIVLCAFLIFLGVILVVKGREHPREAILVAIVVIAIIVVIGGLVAYDLGWLSWSPD